MPSLTQQNTQTLKQTALEKSLIADAVVNVVFWEREKTAGKEWDRKTYLM